ncbi:MAG: hypothetical protein HY707_07795 [Ignavibacteriae bacterium]|nr:hypothetical protein [Ignavibacteriota bacterium]
MHSTYRRYIIAGVAIAILPFFLLPLGCETDITALPPSGKLIHSPSWVDVDKEQAESSPLHVSASVLPTTVIQFDLPVEGIVTLTIHDAQDVEVGKLLDREILEAGSYEVEFDASSLASGVYVYTLVVETLSPEGTRTGSVYTASRKMMLLK